MLKRIGKKVLPVIMSTMLVASMSAVSTLAVEVATEESTAVAKESTVSTYIDAETGVKLESNGIDLNNTNISIADDTAYIGEYGSGLVLKSIFIDVYTSSESYTSIDYSKIPVTAYIPYDVEGCYVTVANVYTEEPTQLEAEYVDGYYKVQMTMLGNYDICSEPLAEDEGELVEQTLADEKTGVTVSGMIRTNSKLRALDAKDRFAGLLNLNYGPISFYLNEEDFEEYEQMTAYDVNLLRNFNVIGAESELTVTLPNENEGLEVRYITEIKDLTESQDESYQKIVDELVESTITDQEIADMINKLLEEVYPVLKSDYADGSYSVNTDKLGLFFVMPKDSLTFTAEDVKIIKENIHNDLSDNPDPPTPEEVTEAVATEQVTDSQQTTVQNTAPTQSATKATTQSTTAQTTGKGAVSTGTGVTVFALALVIALGTATTAIFVFRKKRLSKKTVNK